MRLCLILSLLASSTLARVRSGGGGHSYPSSNGYSGTGSTHKHTTNSEPHSYPHSDGFSGNSNNNNAHTYNSQHYSARHVSGSKIEVHHHYQYSPPQQITYGSTFHPVYHGKPPIYVYEYRDSGSRFDNLLTGLALYNLGRMSANSHDHHYSNREYTGTHGEICKLGIMKPNGEYEEAGIDCRLISSFIWEMNASQSGQVPSKTSSTTVTNTTKIVDNTGSGGNITVITTTMVENKTVDALATKGRSIAVTPGMTCYMIRIYGNVSTLKKNVECGLLQEYARRSLHPNSSVHLNLKSIVVISLNFVCFLFYRLF